MRPDMEQHVRYIKAMQAGPSWASQGTAVGEARFSLTCATSFRIACMLQDQASALAAGVQTLQKQLLQLHFNDEEADTELRPIRDDVNRTSQDLSRLVITPLILACYPLL